MAPPLASAFPMGARARGIPDNKKTARRRSHCSADRAVVRLRAKSLEIASALVIAWPTVGRCVSRLTDHFHTFRPKP